MNIHVDNLSLVESEKHWRQVNGSASDKLLDLLKQHHGGGVEAPEPEAVTFLPGRKRTTLPQSLTHVAAPKERFWFSIESDDYIPQEEPKILDIKIAAVRYFKISRREIDSARRMERVVYPRQIAMFLARAYTTKSLPEIGRHFGGRDHSTVCHAVNKIELLMKSDWLIAYDVAHVEMTL